MRIAVFDTHRFDREALERANAAFGHELHFFEPRLTDKTALQDDVLARLLTFPNTLITSHQGFLTHEALANVRAFERGEPLANEVRPAAVRPSSTGT